ncbi:MAG: rhomboid family intramembrane serine protease [Mariniblastus sp.]
MGYEDRDYYRDETGGGIPGFRFNGQSMVMMLIIVNVVVFFLDSFTNRIEGGDGSHWLCEFMGIKSNRLWHVWTYLTYGFAHASFDTQTGIWHLVVNMFTLFFFGPPLEQKVGKHEFLRFYLLSIIFAGVGWVLLRLFFDSSNAFVVGASGAVSAVLVGFIYLYPRQQIQLMGIIPMPAWVLGVMMLFTNLSYAMRPGSHVAWEAHAAGALFGFLYFKYNWNFSWMNLGGISTLKSKPRLRVHDPGTSGRNEKLKVEADRVLEKISVHGEQSLTSKEKRILNKYSKQLRKKQ